jgi:hypothetical protein
LVIITIKLIFYKLAVLKKMSYYENDEGPFHLSKEERARTKYDQKSGKTRNKFILKTRLKVMLSNMNILNPSGLLPQLQDQCKALNLPITYTEEVTIEGWCNKPKGSLQILFERGWIDPEK